MGCPPSDRARAASAAARTARRRPGRGRRRSRPRPGPAPRCRRPVRRPRAGNRRDRTGACGRPLRPGRRCGRSKGLVAAHDQGGAGRGPETRRASCACRGSRAAVPPRRRSRVGGRGTSRGRLRACPRAGPPLRSAVGEEVHVHRRAGLAEGALEGRYLLLEARAGGTRLRARDREPARPRGPPPRRRAAPAVAGTPPASRPARRGGGCGRVPPPRTRPAASTFNAASYSTRAPRQSSRRFRGLAARAVEGERFRLQSLFGAPIAVRDAGGARSHRFGARECDLAPRRTRRVPGRRAPRTWRG